MVGKLPFDSVLTFMTALGGELPEDHLPSHVLKELPAWMDEFVKKTIVADADKRWQTADEVLASSMRRLMKKYIKRLQLLIRLRPNMRRRRCT